MNGEHTSRREVVLDNGETKLAYRIRRWEDSSEGYKTKYRISLYKYERVRTIFKLYLGKRWHRTADMSITLDDEDFSLVRAKDAFTDFRGQLVEGKSDPLDSWLDTIIEDLEEQ